MEGSFKSFHKYIFINTDECEWNSVGKDRESFGSRPGLVCSSPMSAIRIFVSLRIIAVVFRKSVILEKS